MEESERDHELAMYAHEMRGTLTIIAGYAEMLRRDLTTEERVRASDGVQRAVSRADQLVSALLSGHVSVTACDVSSTVDLAAITRQVAEEHEVASARSIVTDVPESLIICGDGVALGRVIDNLVSNALKYSLGRSNVELKLRRAPQIAVLEVSDRGPGIAIADRETVFEPYIRLQRDRSVSGTGLGLSVVKRIVEAHGGTIVITDREGGGTIVRVELPYDASLQL